MLRTLSKFGLAGLTLESIVGIVSTHLHPDHLGMVRYLADETGAWVAMHQIEAEALDRMVNDPHDDEETLHRWGERVGHGMDGPTFVAAARADCLASDPDAVDAYDHSAPVDQCFLGLERYWRKRGESAG